MFSLTATRHPMISMEQKQLPTSPLQRCYPSLPTGPETSESETLSVPRPSTSSSNAAVVTIPISPWPRKEQQVDETWRSITPIWSSDVSSPQSEGSSSRCPSTLPASKLDRPSGCPQFRRLLTSGPLNRSISPIASPTLPLNLPSRTTTSKRKRPRSVSLPSPTSYPKRHRSRPCSFNKWQSSLGNASSHPSGDCGRQARAAGSWNDFDAPIQQGSSIRKGYRICIAVQRPLINTETLRQTDTSELLQDRQLRHDLLFNNVAFRSTGMTAPTPLAESGAIRQVTSQVTSRTASVRADMYWDSIAAEISSGCRCTRWKAKLGTWEKPERVNSCVCGKWMRNLSEEGWWECNQVGSRWRSRLPELVKSEFPSDGISRFR